MNHWVRRFPHDLALAAVFAAMFEIGIVVDLDHRHAVARLLEVDAVEPLERCSSPPLRRSSPRPAAPPSGAEASKAALHRPAAPVMLDDLPVLLDHQILHGQKDGSPPSTPMRQSNSVGRYSCAIRRSESSSHAVARLFVRGNPWRV